MNIAVVANTSWYLFNFRRNLITALQSEGHRVVTVAGRDAYSARLADDGVEHCSIPFSGAGVNPLREFLTIVALRRVLKEKHIHAVLSYTPKGNTYSAIALAGMNARLVVNVSGLGRSFASSSALRRLVQQLYRYTFSRAAWVFFQNDEDRNFFLDKRLVRAQRSSRLPGSGVDLLRFSAIPPAQSIGLDASPPKFLLIARLLWEKGIGEFVEAARIVRRRHPKAEFRLLGGMDPPSRAAVPRLKIDQWSAEGIIEYLGTTDDVRPFLREADCIVLPSVYREGVPRSLLEAAAMGRPIVTTDSVGCRDTVDDGITGYLCRPLDAADLASCMLRFLDLSLEARTAMGQSGRSKMEREFDEKYVLASYSHLLSTFPTT